MSRSFSTIALIAAFGFALAGCGGTSDDSPGAVKVPEAPTGLWTNPLSPTEVALQWTDRSDDETGFSIERTSPDAPLFAQVGMTGPDATYFLDTGRQPGTTYTYRVSAFNSAGLSSPTAEASATTLTLLSPPAAPWGAVASALSASSIELAWNDASLDETSFEVERATAAGGTFTLVQSLGADATSFTDTGLSSSTEYLYRVRAVNGAGASSYTDVTSATTSPDPGAPAAPTNLSVVAVYATGISLQWTDTVGEAGYEIERAPSLDGPYSPVGNSQPDAPYWGDSGLSASTTYFYRVRASSAAGYSGFSDVVSATTLPVAASPPAAPTGAVATALSPWTLRVSWIDNSTDEESFHLERAASAEGPFEVMGGAPADVTQVDDPQLSPGSTFYYRVRAWNTAGYSSYSNVATATTRTVPNAPAMLQVTVQSPASLHLSWIDTSLDETGFRVERASGAYGPFTPLETLPAGATGWDDTGLPPSTTFWYRIVALGALGDSDVSNTAGGTTQPPVVVLPAQPSGPGATVLSSTAIRVTWTDASTFESGFRVERATSAAGPFATAGHLAANATGFDDAGLEPSTTYHYRVCATSPDGDSEFSVTVSATTLAPSLPTAPADALATTMSSSSLRVTWTDASADESWFEVERATAVDGPFVAVGSTPANRTTHDDTGLAPGTTYFYRIRSVNAAGASGYSSTASATTASATVQHLELLPSSDLMIEFSSLNEAAADRNWSGSENGVGCVWTLFWDGIAGMWMQHALCASSVFRFDVSALAGKRIVAAALWLWAEVPPPPPNEQGTVNATALTTRALAGPWTPSTLSWNTLPPTYAAGEWMVASPTAPGPVGWSVTTAVQNWVDGTWANDGLLVEDFNVVFPYLSAIRVTSFASLEYYSDPSHRPVLAIDYE
jgi:titin